MKVLIVSELFFFFFFFKLVQHMIFGFRLFYIAVSFGEVQSPGAREG